MTSSLPLQLDRVSLIGLEVRLPGEGAADVDDITGTAEFVTGDQVHIRLDDGGLASAPYHQVEVVDMDAYRVRADALSVAIRATLEGAAA